MKYEGIITSKTNNYIYAYLGNDEYKNISTGVTKTIPLIDAKKLFNIPITLNLFAERNPCIISLIEKLGMSLEPYTEEEKNIFLENAMKNLDGN